MKEIYCKCEKPNLVKVHISHTVIEVCSKRNGGCGCEYSPEALKEDNSNDVIFRREYLAEIPPMIVDNKRRGYQTPTAGGIQSAWDKHWSDMAKKLTNHKPSQGDGLRNRKGA